MYENMQTIEIDENIVRKGEIARDKQFLVFH